MSPFYSSIINFSHSCLKKMVVNNLFGELSMVFLVSSWFDTMLGLNMWPPLDPPKHFRSNSCIYVGLGSHLLKLSLQALIELNRIKKMTSLRRSEQKFDKETGKYLKATKVKLRKK